MTTFQSLPPEIVAQIFKIEHFRASIQTTFEERSTARSIATVCKEWSNYGQCILYDNLEMFLVKERGKPSEFLGRQINLINYPRLAKFVTSIRIFFTPRGCDILNKLYNKSEVREWLVKEGYGPLLTLLPQFQNVDTLVAIGSPWSVILALEELRSNLKCLVWYNQSPFDQSVEIDLINQLQQLLPRFEQLSVINFISLSPPASQSRTTVLPVLNAPLEKLIPLEMLRIHSNADDERNSLWIDKLIGMVDPTSIRMLTAHIRTQQLTYLNDGIYKNLQELRIESPQEPSFLVYFLQFFLKYPELVRASVAIKTSSEADLFMYENSKPTVLGHLRLQLSVQSGILKDRETGIISCVVGIKRLN